MGLPQCRTLLGGDAGGGIVSKSTREESCMLSSTG